MVLPAALPGIITGIVLALARIAGETAPLLFTAFNNRFFSTRLDQPIASLTVQVFTYAISPYEDWHRQAWAGALVLVAIVLGLLGARAVCDAPAGAPANRTLNGMSPVNATKNLAAPPTPRPRSNVAAVRRVGLRSSRCRTAIEVEQMSFYYGAKQALFDISSQAPARNWSPRSSARPGAARARSCARSTG